MFGLFGKEPTPCDWCGAEIEGEGIEADGLRLCSQGCLDQKNAPPAAAPAPSGAPEPRAMTAERARSELAIALAEVEQYARLSVELEQETNCESEFMDSQQSYFLVWERLDRVRQYVAERGGAVADYDIMRATSVANPDRYDIVTVTSHNGRDSRNVGTASFQPDNLKLLCAAIEVMQTALGAVP